MVRSTRIPSFSNIESKAMDLYLSSTEIGGVIYEFNQALSFPIEGGISSESKLLAGIHNWSASKAFAPVKRELERRRYTEAEVSDRLSFIESNALMAVSNFLGLNFDEVEQSLFENATAFADSTRKDWIASDLNSIEEFVEKHLADQYVDKSFLWRKYVLDFWNKKPNKPRLTSSKTQIVEKVSPGATDWISKAKVAKESESKIRKPKKSKRASQKIQPRKAVENVLDFEALKKRVNTKRNSAKRVNALLGEPAYLLSIPKAGWSWMCDYHQIYGLTDDEEEALFMAGAHMHYTEVDGDVCELFMRDWSNSQ